MLNIKTRKMLTAIKAYENIRKITRCDIWQYLKKFYYPGQWYVHIDSKMWSYACYTATLPRQHHKHIKKIE